MAPAAVITGSSGGIGRECVRELAPDKDVLIQYHTNEESAKSLAEEVRDNFDGNATTHGCDISSFKEVQTMMEHARSEFDSIDVLVNNAGILLEKPVPDMTPDHIMKVLSVNLVGTMYCTQEVLPEMRERGQGWIVNVSSTGGSRGSSTAPAYSAAKAGMIGFTKALTRKYTADGILANVVAPSSVDTDMYPEKRREAAAETFPQGRLIRPEEVAEAVGFLATTSYVSGKVLEVDGGKYT